MVAAIVWWIARATTSRGARSASGCTLGHERDAVGVAEHRAFAAQRLGEQRARHRRVVQRGRVELHELEVGARDARLQRERDTVAGRKRRVGRDREALADATGREHDVDGAHELDLAVGPERDHAGATIVLDEQLDREPALANLDRAALDRGDERTLDLGAGRVAARVHDAGERMTALAGEQQLVAVGAGLGVELRAERRQLADTVGALGHEHLHRLDVAEPGARGERVGEMQLPRVGLGQRGGDAALRVTGGRERQLALREHDRRQALPSGLERGRETGDTAPEHENVDHEPATRP